MHTPPTYTLLPATGVTHHEIEGFIEALPTRDDNIGSECMAVAVKADEISNECKSKLRAKEHFISDYVYTHNPDYLVFEFKFDVLWYEDVMGIFTGQPSKLSKEYIAMLVEANPDMKEYLTQNQNQDATEVSTEEHNEKVKETLQ